MSQLTDNLNAIASIKSDIAAAIENKGVSMTGVPFGSYADKIGEIQTGGSFVTEPLNVTDNGVYTPGQGVDGYSQVTVNVPQSVTGYTEKELTEKKYTIVNLSNSASYVASSAFQNTNTLLTVNLPNCEWIGYAAFNRCSSLSEISIPNCLSIGQYAFAGCRSLRSLNLPNCERIQPYAFSECRSLIDISIPNCSSIELSAFVGCTSLRSLNLPNCEWIGQSAFYNCSSLSEISIPNCSYLADTFQYTSISYLELPMLVTLAIQYAAFLSNIKTISMCRDVALVPDTNGTTMTYQFNNIETIYVPSDTYNLFVSKFSSHSSKFVSFALSGGPMLSFSNGLLYGSTRALNSTVWQIVGASKSDLTAISLPNCEYFSDYYAYPFSGCSNLSVVSLPKCKKLHTTFNYCSSLSQITLGAASVCTLVNYAFAGTPIQQGTGSIYVPSFLVNAYKSAPYWSSYSSRIFPIPE